MLLKIGEKIKELRKRERITQETLADAIGVTSQAISRWEAGGGYPDMETLPVIANYFDVAIDELFGYEDEKGKVKKRYYSDKVNEITNKRELVPILREAVAEFPNDDWLLYRLGEALYYIDMKMKGFYWYINEQNSNTESPEKLEAEKIFKRLIKSDDSFVKGNSARMLIKAYHNRNEFENAKRIAETLPFISECQEFMMVEASPKDEYQCNTEKALLSLIRSMIRNVIDILLRQDTLELDIKIRKLSELVAICGMFFDDGKYGWCHQDMGYVHKYLVKWNAKFGDLDAAFKNLDLVLDHRIKLNIMLTSGNYHYGAVLFKHVVDYRAPVTPGTNFVYPLSVLEDEISLFCEDEMDVLTKDPRWALWLEKIQDS